MHRAALKLAVLSLTAFGFANAALSHHPSRVEPCQLITLEGELERIEWTNPHVQLVIRTESGEREQVSWLNVHRLALSGIDNDTLRIGDRLVIQGGFLPLDVAARPILISSIRRASDGWEWSQPAEGC